MINNKQFIYKNITNNKNIQLIFSNDLIINLLKN